MNLKVEPKNLDEAYCTPIIQQTFYWSRVKKRLGEKSAAFELTVRNSDIYAGTGGYSYTHSDLILYFKRLNSNEYVAYCPYGPETEPSSEFQGEFLEEISESLKSFLPKGCLAIKYDLNWESHWVDDDCFDENGAWTGLPDRSLQEFNLNFNTITRNLRKANSDILPANTVMLDLRESEEEILSRMKPKTRYNIHLSEKHGITVRSTGIEGLETWRSLYEETAIRNGLHLNEMNYFQSMFLPSLEKRTDDVTVHLLTAFDGDTPLAAMFLVISGLRATYLYGASSTSGRNKMPAYALQWNAIKTAKAAGCIDYDMFGVAPTQDSSHPMHGLYRFKQGFGGSIYHQLGCWDYPIEKKGYSSLQTYEMKLQGYYL